MGSQRPHHRSLGVSPTSGIAEDLRSSKGCLDCSFANYSPGLVDAMRVLPYGWLLMCLVFLRSTSLAENAEVGLSFLW